MFNDLSNQKFGRLTALFTLDEKAANGEKLWMCQCKCGGTKIVKTSHLTGGNTQSCGCIRNKKIAGQKFGKLTAIKSRRRREDNRVVWLCQCDCGNTIEVITADLLNGTILSCGCLGTKKTKLKKATGRKTDHTAQLEGKRFYNYVILKDTGYRYFEYVVWQCKCDCGKIFTAPSCNILNGRIKSCGCKLNQHKKDFGLKAKRHNKYIFNQIGIGYTLKGEKFYFDKEDYNKIKDYCWRTNKYGQFIAYNQATYPKKQSVIAFWRVLFDEYDMNKKITYKNGNKWDLRKKNLEIV